MAIAVKVTTVGNSTGIVLPKELLGHLNVEKGDTLYISKTSNGFYLTAYDETFMRKMDAMEKVMGNYRDALKKLAE